MNKYVDFVYDIVRKDCAGMDAIYKNHIIHLVGVCGLNELLEHKLLETCGVIGDRQLYVLCNKK